MPQMPDATAVEESLARPMVYPDKCNRLWCACKTQVQLHGFPEQTHVVTECQHMCTSMPAHMLDIARMHAFTYMSSRAFALCIWPHGLQPNQRLPQRTAWCDHLRFGTPGRQSSKHVPKGLKVLRAQDPAQGPRGPNPRRSIRNRINW